MLDVFMLQKEFEILGKITGAIIRKKTRAMLHQDRIETGLGKGKKQYILYIIGVHRGGELLGPDVAREIIQYG